jgi:hypothetical protein
MLALFESCRAVHAHLLIDHSSLHLIRAGEVDEIILTTSANNMSSSVQHVRTGNGGRWHLEVFKWSISLCASGQEGMLSTSQAINLNKLVCASACRGCAIVHRISLTGAPLKARLQAVMSRTTAGVAGAPAATCTRPPKQGLPGLSRSPARARQPIPHIAS